MRNGLVKNLGGSMKNYNLFDYLIITLVTISGTLLFMIFAFYAAGLIC